MTQLIHKIVLLLCILGCSASVMAASSSEAEYKKLSKSWTLNADGSKEFHYNMELTIYTYTAMRSKYGESFVTYNPKYQTLKINSSYTKQKDGTIVKTPDNAFVEVLPSSAANAPYYNGLKEMVIVHTGLELGATIYLDYTLTTKAGYMPELDIVEPIEQSSPVKEYNISISVPNGDELNYGTVNYNSKANEKTSNGIRQVSWSFKNVPAASRAPYRNSDAPLFIATTYPSQKEALNTLYAQLETKESMPLLSLAETVTSGKSSDAEKVQAVLSFVHNDFAHSSLSLEETGYLIRPVEDVINSAYGTNAELINLMQGLLSALKIENEVCAMYPIPNPDSKMGLKNVRLFIKAMADNRTWLLNPNTESMDEAGWMSGRYYIADLKNGTEVTMPVVNADIKYDIAITVNSGKASLQVKSDISEALKSYVGSPEKSLEANVSEQNGIMIVSLPDSPKGIAHSAYVKGNTTRDCNLVLPYASNETYSYSVQIPDGKECITPVLEKNLSNAAGTVQVTVRQNGNTMEVKRNIKLNSSTISKADYTAFHTLLATWVNENYNVLMFKDK